MHRSLPFAALALCACSLEPGVAAPPTDVVVEGAPAPALDAACASGDVTSWRAGEERDEQLVVVGVHQSASTLVVDDGAGTFASAAGEVHVVVDRPGRAVTLGLMSYGESQWIVEAPPDTKIVRVLIGGHDAQSVGAPVTPEAIELDAYAHAWPSSAENVDTKRALRAFEEASGLALSAFAGCYEGGTFSFRSDAR